jgi:hypothetical protein
VVKGAFGLWVGLLVALGARTALAEGPIQEPAPSAPANATTTVEPAAATAPANGAPGSTLSAPAPAPPSAPATITVGMPQPTVRPINQSIGIGVALTYVSIPLVLLSGAVLGVGYLVDSDGAKVTGWVMTGTSVALFGVGVGFLVSGSEQGPQPQKSTSAGRPTRLEPSTRVTERERGLAVAVPLISGTF